VFMLTVDEVKNVSFRKANIGGYRCDEVDNFIDDVVLTIEELKSEKFELVAKMEILANKIEEYRQEEESVHNALVSAQKLSNQKIKEAENEAEKILSAAKKQADNIIADANERIIKQKELIIRIEQEAADVRKKLTDAYELQISALTVLPDQLDVDTTLEDLGERYPTQTYSDEESDEEEEFTSIEAAVEAATVNNVVEPIAEEDAETIQIEKSVFERKFGKLKFGEDYDVASE
nr:DivIVA domain-containing protein [Lachnospiraceae bacterium]